MSDGSATAMGLVGERWSLVIVRELLLGPRRFGDIRRGLPGLSANVLTQRLESLESSGVLRRGALPSLATVQIYELTPWGYSAEEAILALGRWAASKSAPDTIRFSSTAFMLFLKSTVGPTVGPLAQLDIGFRVGGEPYRTIVTGSELRVRRADTAGAPIVFGGDPSDLAVTFFGSQTLAQSQLSGRVAVAGDLATAQAFVNLFTIPTISNE